jgi:uncharacterized RDD family membrane protein YckC
MLKTADKGARLGNFIIDIFIILIFYVTIILVFVVVFSDFTNNHVPELEFLFLVIYLLYYIFLESIYGKTFGKMITKTFVVDKNYKKPSILRIILRTLFRLIPFGAMAFLFNFSCFHDIWSGTRVVKI